MQSAKVGCLALACWDIAPTMSARAATIATHWNLRSALSFNILLLWILASTYLSRILTQASTHSLCSSRLASLLHLYEEGARRVKSIR